MNPTLVLSHPVVSTTQLPKRFRPPNLTLPSDRRTNTVIETESPIVVHPDEDDELSSPSSSSYSSPFQSLLNVDTDTDPVSDDISDDLAALERIRKNVRENLRLRPIRSTGQLPKVDLQRSPFSSSHSPSWRDPHPQIASSPTLTSASPSVYFTPLSENQTSPLTPSLAGRYIAPSHAYNLHPHKAQPLDPGSLFDRLTSSKRPLLIDARPPPSHVASHIQHSINIAVPSLILKRCRKPGGGLQSLDALRQFITTEQGKVAWDSLIHHGDSWDTNVVIYDDEMDLSQSQGPSWHLIPVIIPLLTHGSVYYLHGGISAARGHRRLRNLILSGGDFDFGGDAFQVPSQIRKGSGLFQLDVESATRPKPYPEVEQPTRTPLPTMSTVTPDNVNILDSSPSPPPSQLVFHRPRPPQRRPSAPNLGRLDTKSAERLNTNLPKLQLRTLPVKSATLTVPPLHPPIQPHSPSHLNLVHSNHSPPDSATWTTSPTCESGQIEFYKTPFTSYYTPPHTPGTPMPYSPSPATARPDLEQPPTTEEHAEEFSISAILPNFLFLGPELTTQEHLEEIQDLGIKRILNMAAECDDDKGFHLREIFERYVKIPWRDTVEEENIAKGVRDVCEILGIFLHFLLYLESTLKHVTDDARLHSAPTYVHCRAGKSRSVTAVMAYLIHANHWTLSQAYAFVVERRKGISPNIGFVSELMTFEEEELGGKSNGVQPSTSGEQAGEHHESGAHGNFAPVGNRRAGHIRESLPPVFVTQNSDGNFAYACPMSADPVSNARVGDSGQEMEIKDSSGRYRHARRAPVDEQTLQPLRRVSKAGLESSAYA